MLPTGESGKITIAVRVRPFSAREIALKDSYCAVNCRGENQIICTKKGLPPVVFPVDFAFCPFEGDACNFAKGNQHEVYNSLGLPLLNKALAGYNACLFTYGVTSSGKTYSMYGTPDAPGIVPRITEDLFSLIAGKKASNSLISVHLNYFEIYKEKINDLLQDKKPAPQLTVREHPVTGPFVEGLLQPAVHTPEEVFAWLRQGDARRSVAATQMNAFSSRSHTILAFIITRRELARFTKTEVIENVYTSRLNLVDLAGSERQSLTNNTNERLVESCQINKSLFTLSKVISQLSGDLRTTMNCRSTDRPKRKRPPFSPCGTPEFRTPVVDSRRKQSNFISYRDSTLTWILKESLGGNSVTAMLATVSPSSLHIDDTLATLQYVKRAQCIVNNAVVNEDPEGRIIRELMSEIERLRQCLNAAEAPHSPLATQVQTLKKLLLAREEEVNFLTTELTKRTVDCERLQVAISQVTPFGTPKRLVNFLDDSDDNGNTPVIPSKRLKSDSCSTNSGTSDSPGDDRLAPDGADHYPIHEWTKNEATVLTQKIESAVQTEGVNEVNTNNAQIFGCHTGIISNNQTDPQSLALSYRKCGICSWEPVRKIDASSNTCDVDLGCGLISQRGLEYTDLELHVVGKPLNVLLDVKKKDVSIGVSENASDLSVLPIQELSLMREVINHSSEAMFSEAGINTIEEVEVLPKQIFLEMKQKILLLESTLATYTCKVKHEVGTSSDDHDCRIPFEKSSKQSTEETHNTTKGFAVFKGKKLVDSSVLTNDTELDVTYMSVNLFNRLYERLHNLRMRVDVLESKTTSDANVATDEDIQVLQAGADGFLTRMDEPSPVLTRYKRGLSDNKKMGNNVEVCVNMKNRLEKMTEHLTEPGHTLDKEVKMVDVSTLTNDIIESTCINEVSEDAAASPIVLGDGEKSVRSRVDFFEKLKQDNALATSGRALLGSKEVSVVSVKPKKVPVDSTINEDMKQSLIFFQSQLERQRWDIEYLEQTNRRLSTERNTMAKMLACVLREGSERRTSSSQVLKCLDYTGQVSEEFRREMEAIIMQYGHESSPSSADDQNH